MWRQLLAPHFAPRAMERLEDRVRERCTEVIAEIAGRGHCDFLRDFAWRYPTTIFMELMGLPLDGLDQFLAWEHQILHPAAGDDPERAGAFDAMMAVMGYFTELIEEKRKHPTDDLLSSALEWRIEGQPIPHEDLLSWCLLMFMAGLDTVSIQLSYAFWHLATHTADRRRIAEDPAVIPAAVEEFLRQFAFVAPSRKVMQDSDFHGCPLKRGDMVFLPLSGATRDPGAVRGWRHGALRPSRRTTTSRSGRARTAVSDRISPGVSCAWRSRNGTAPSPSTGSPRVWR